MRTGLRQLLGARARVAALALLFVLCSGPTGSAQAGLPVLQAHSATLDIVDDGRLFKGVWVADPSAPLDIYDARRSDKGRKVTFVSDAGSLSFDVQPGQSYDFIVLLEGRACHTRIATSQQSYERVGADAASGPLALPITIAHGKLHVQGTINGSPMLDLIFDTGSSTNVVYPSAVAKGVKVVYDGAALNGGTGGTTLRKTSRDNRVELSGLRWSHEPMIFVEKQADDADGIIGYPVFDNKSVELDYDRMLLIVHDALPSSAATFTRTPMTFAGFLTSVPGVLVNGTTRVNAAMILDTAASGTLTANQALAAAPGLRAGLQKLGTSRSSGVGSGVLRNEKVMLPELVIAGFSLPKVPIHLELPSEGDKSPPAAKLGMEVLSRFNTLIDYAHSDVYFKPNKRFQAPFPVGLPPSALVAIVLLGVLVVAVLAAIMAKRRRRVANSP